MDRPDALVEFRSVRACCWPQVPQLFAASSINLYGARRVLRASATLLFLDRGELYWVASLNSQRCWNITLCPLSTTSPCNLFARHCLFFYILSYFCRRQGNKGKGTIAEPVNRQRNVKTQPPEVSRQRTHKYVAALCLYEGHRNTFFQSQQCCQLHRLFVHAESFMACVGKEGPKKKYDNILRP